MKKIKFMLLSLALVAVVGGALAFKAKFSTTFCTTNAVDINGASYCTTTVGGSAIPLTCPTTYTGTVQGGNAQFVCTTPEAIGGGCPQSPALQCGATLTSITTDN